MEKLDENLAAKVTTKQRRVFATIAEGEGLTESHLLRKLISEYLERKILESEAICQAANCQDLHDLGRKRGDV